MARKDPYFCGFFATRELVKELDVLAKQQDRSRSALIRRLIKAELKRNKKRG